MIPPEGGGLLSTGSGCLAFSVATCLAPSNSLFPTTCTDSLIQEKQASQAESSFDLSIPLEDLDVQILLMEPHRLRPTAGNPPLRV